MSFAVGRCSPFSSEPPKGQPRALKHFQNGWIGDQPGFARILLLRAALVGPNLLIFSEHHSSFDLHNRLETSHISASADGSPLPMGYWE